MPNAGILHINYSIKNNEKRIMKHFKYILLAVWVSALFTQCKESEKVPTPSKTDKLLIATAASDNGTFKVELYANDSLIAGYNAIFLRITDEASGEILTAAEISLKPVMRMMGMTHSAPFENPANLAVEEDLFEGAVVFIMPSNPDEGWSLEADIEAQGKVDHVNLTIPKVIEPEDARLVRVLSTEENTTFFISLLEPASPMVGINNLEFTVHYRENMMSFPPAKNVSVSFVPEMPSMNHGSPNNQEPEHDINGHYLGKVNFTMTGWWRLNVTLEKDGEIIDNTVQFNINF